MGSEMCIRDRGHPCCSSPHRIVDSHGDPGEVSPQGNIFQQDIDRAVFFDHWDGYGRQAASQRGGKDGGNRPVCEPNHRDVLATGAHNRYQHHGFATTLNILQDGAWIGTMEDVGPRSNPAPTYADHQLHVESRIPQSFDGETRRSEVSAGVRGLRGCEISDEMKFFYNNSAKYGAFWEFARDLLRMEEFNPSILRWEHQESGLFRVVSKAGLGKLWSLVKGNLTQDYGRIRMVLREYRGQGKIDIVNTTSLLYRFGPQAVGWDWRPDEYGDQVRLVGQKVRCKDCLCLFLTYLQLDRHRSRLCAGQLVPPLKAGWSLVPEGEQRPGDWERLGSFYREDSPEYEPQPLFPGVSTLWVEKGNIRPHSRDQAVAT